MQQEREKDMADNFFDYMYGINKKVEKDAVDAAKPQVEPQPEPTKEATPEKPAMDEGIGEWTHKYVVYCKDPRAEFEEELKAKDGVVAVFVKEKESKPSPSEVNPPDAE